MPEQRYWDATAFAAWLGQDTERANGCGEVLARAEAGDCVIWTSPLAMVACVEDDGWSDVEPSDRLTVYDFFRRRYVKLVQLDRAVAEFAWDIMADHKLSHSQAVHLASALRARAEVLETFDVELLKLDEKVAGHPHLRIQRPRVTKGPLFDLLDELPLEEDEEAETRASGTAPTASAEHRPTAVETAASTDGAPADGAEAEAATPEVGPRVTNDDARAEMALPRDAPPTDGSSRTTTSDKPVSSPDEAQRPA